MLHIALGQAMRIPAPPTSHTWASSRSAVRLARQADEADEEPAGLPGIDRAGDDGHPAPAGVRGATRGN